VSMTPCLLVTLLLLPFLARTTLPLPDFAEALLIICCLPLPQPNNMGASACPWLATWISVSLEVPPFVCFIYMAMRSGRAEAFCKY
jgi:hypothetical protein